MKQDCCVKKVSVRFQRVKLILDVSQRPQEMSPTSPELPAHFAEEEADSQQAEGMWRAENTSSVVMQVLPQTTCKSLNEANNIFNLIMYVYIKPMKKSVFLVHRLLNALFEMMCL